jgi:hypothetical protein
LSSWYTKFLLSSPQGYPKIAEFVYQVRAIFGSTYICEQFFAYEKEQNTLYITAEADAFVTDYIGHTAQDLKHEIRTLLQTKGVKFLGKNTG